MEAIYKTYKHAPPHLFRPNAKYFITGATYKKKHFLQSEKAKVKTLEYMFKSFEHFGWFIEDWVLLNNHYHLMAQAPQDAVTLAQVINNFHKFSAIWIKKHITEYSGCVAGTSSQTMYSKTDSKTSLKTDFKNVSKIWYNYWDTCITYENSYFARINYIWFNPVKHGYIKDAQKWQFGSFNYRAKNWDSVKEIVENYPWDKVNVEDDF